MACKNSSAIPFQLRSTTQFSHDGELSVVHTYDLSFLTDFSCECADVRVAEALKDLVARWLLCSDDMPHFLGKVEDELNLTSSEAVHIRWLLALNPNTPPSILDELYGEGVNTVLERLAENPRTSSDTLTNLAYQAVVDIRIAAGGNINMPIASIMMLAADDSVDVRLSLAENHNIPFAALEVLARDDNPFVKFRAEKTLTRLRT